MSVVAWGKPSIFIQEVGSKKNEWTKIDTPKEGTTQTNATKGDTIEAKEEGGGLVDRKVQKSTYELSYQLFIKKNLAQPFKTIDGIVEGNYRVAVQPEDPDNPGFYMGNTSVSCEETISSSDGSLVNYTHTGLVPDGDVVASTTNGKEETVYCAARWRIITATKTSDGKYALTFKHPYGEKAGEVITETYSQE